MGQRGGISAVKELEGRARLDVGVGSFGKNMSVLSGCEDGGIESVCKNVGIGSLCSDVCVVSFCKD
jgi:hypothetical protein